MSEMVLIFTKLIKQRIWYLVAYLLKFNLKSKNRVLFFLFSILNAETMSHEFLLDKLQQLVFVADKKPSQNLLSSVTLLYSNVSPVLSLS